MNVGGKSLIIPKWSDITVEERFRLGYSEPCFIIAEIGQNHQGDINLAKQMIKLAKECGADCVKFQKSDLKSKFNKKALLRPYRNENSWGDTYGQHKEHLEFSEDQFIELQNYAREVNVLFTASAMDEVSLQFLHSINVPFIKIGSGDFHNKPLLRKAAKCQKPLIISSGMSNIDEVIDVYNTIKAEHTNFGLLHCISSYPAPLNEINLNVIRMFQKLFPDIVVGYSGHELGFEITVAAVALGAKVIERHFTLNKNWKGSDHICSLTPNEFKKMVHLIRSCETSGCTSDIFLSNNVQLALGEYDRKFQNSELVCYNKLGKTIVAAKDLNKDEVITEDSICVKVSEPKGIPAKMYDTVIGRILNRNVTADESLFECDLQ